MKFPDTLNEASEKQRFTRRMLRNNPSNSESVLYNPGRVVSVLYRNQGRALKTGLMTLILITALYTKAYTGDFQTLINNHIGGIFYVMFGSLVFSVFFPKMKMVIPVIVATGATCILEFIQWFRFPVMVELTRIKAFAYLFGNSFNPEDFIFYGIGSALALLLLWTIREN